MVECFFFLVTSDASDILVILELEHYYVRFGVYVDAVT